MTIEQKQQWQQQITRCISFFHAVRADSSKCHSTTVTFYRQRNVSLPTTGIMILILSLTMLLILQTL